MGQDAARGPTGSRSPFAPGRSCTEPDVLRFRTWNWPTHGCMPAGHIAGRWEAVGVAWCESLRGFSGITSTESGGVYLLVIVADGFLHIGTFHSPSLKSCAISSSSDGGGPPQGGHNGGLLPHGRQEGARELPQQSENAVSDSARLLWLQRAVRDVQKGQANKGSTR